MFIFSLSLIMFTTYTLPNKLRLVVSPVPTVGSVTVLVLVKAGSRYEHQANNGIAHFLEHMFFKGAKKYVNAKQVAMAVDDIGGVSNAFTDKEYVGYYIRVASEYVETAFDILSDMLLESTFPEEEIHKERNVILEEMHMYQDAPAQQIFWNFEKHILGDQPLGWDEIGTKECLDSITQKDFFAYKKQLYTPDRMVISVAGNVTPKYAKDLTEKYFGSMQDEAQTSFIPFLQNTTPTLSIQHKDTDQAHLMLGYFGLPMTHPLRTAQKVLTTILGGNSSSRMFQELREERGLCYYVHTGSSSYHDTGTLYAKAGIALQRIEEALPALVAEMKKGADASSFTNEELMRAKNYMKGTLALSMEDTESVAHFMGKEWLLKDEISTFEDVKERIDHCSMEDLKQVSSLLTNQQLYVSIIGPYKEKQSVLSTMIH